MRAIALSLCIAGMFSGCRSGSTKGVALEHSIEQLIPGDTVMLAGARVEAMLTTPLYKRLSSNVQLVPELDSFSKRTGLDPRKDLKEFVIASNGKDTIGIAQVQLESPEKLEALLEKEGLRRTAFGKYTLMAGDSSTVAFLGKTIAIAGPNEAVKRALSPPGDESRKNEVLKRVALLPAGKHFWVAAIGGSAPMPLPETGNLANLARVFQSMESVTLTLDLQDGASLAVAGECRKP
ncbi:MAG: hypothetical protein HYZ37_01310 [Candidatus Solibacter usitatus]|nr:hypothetical protein [Candidatus Solibacter usitatus]